jgi:hypothetical protein
MYGTLPMEWKCYEAFLKDLDMVLDNHKLDKHKIQIGVDIAESQIVLALINNGYKFADGQSVMQHARAIKNEDEIMCLKHGAAIKIAHNFVLGCAVETMGEGVALVRKFGVDPGVILRVLTEGLFAAPAYKIYGEIIVDESYDNVGVTALIGLKDANLARAAGKAVDVPLPSVEVWRERLIGAVEHGDGERDWAVVAREQARLSGLE